MTWDPDILNRINAADEIELSSHRADGSLRPFIIMWMGVADGDLFVRSAHGPENGWYRRALASGTGRIRAGGVEADVSFAHAPAADQASIDADYHRKYDRYGARIVGSVVGEHSYDVTMRIDPIDSGENS